MYCALCKYLFHDVVSKFCHLFLQYKRIFFKLHLSLPESTKHFKIGLERENKESCLAILED